MEEYDDFVFDINQCIHQGQQDGSISAIL